MKSFGDCQRDADMCLGSSGTLEPAVEAKILNIYNSWRYPGESPIAYVRLFYIARDGTIKIVEAGEGESSEALRKAYEIKIKNNGVILINKFK